MYNVLRKKQKDPIEFIDVLLARRLFMDPMSIASLSMSMYQTQALSQVGTAVLDMSLDSARTQGASMVSALEQLPSPSLDPNVGTRFDASV